MAQEKFSDSLPHSEEAERSVLGAILVVRARKDRTVFLGNVGLYWHLVDMVWIFLFPLFYLIG